MQVVAIMSRIGVGQVVALPFCMIQVTVIADFLKQAAMQVVRNLAAGLLS